MAIAHGREADSLVFCGLVGIMDPPRTSAITFAETMQVCARPLRETLTYVPRTSKHGIFARAHNAFNINSSYAMKRTLGTAVLVFLPWSV